MNLRHEDGVFVFECDYLSKEIPRASGFSWHFLPCNRKDCKACEIGIEKAWITTDFFTAQKLLQYADESAQQALDLYKASLDDVLQASRAEDADIFIPAPDGLEYLPYQKAGVAFAADRSGTLIADEMGLGKTIQALGLINLRDDISRVLIICPASLKINWRRESEKWLTRPLSISIAESKSILRTNVVIINYDILGNHREELRREKWDLIVLDEAHYIKNPDAARSREVFGGRIKKVEVSPIPTKRKLALTGTPIENRPAEIWSLWNYLSATAPAHHVFMQNYYDGEQEEIYLRGQKGKKRKVWKYGEPKNLDDLQTRLRAEIMIRRKTIDVLRDLPPKRRQIIELPNDSVREAIQLEFTAYQDYISAHQSVINAKELFSEDDYRQRITELKAIEGDSVGNLAKARKDLALRKIPFIIEHIESAIESSGKVVLFLYHRDVIDSVNNHFGGRSVKFYGGMSPRSKQESVDRFCNDPGVSVFVASIIAAGVGLNLTVSSLEVFGEIDWVPGRIEQAEKRCHRIGQTRSVLIQHLTFEASLDCVIAKKIVEKLNHIERALDVSA